MGRLSVVVSCAIDTYSGYGARSRDFVKALIETKKYNVQILSQRWGNTRTGYLEDHGETDLLSRIIPQLTSQPDIWFQITVPNEFQKVGKYNIGVTAGIETTLCHSTWLQGCNNMDLVLVSSNHAKTVFESTKFEMVDSRSGHPAGTLELTTPVEVLFEGVDLEKYGKKVKTKVDLSKIKEKFCYLTVGHWMQGDLGHDRKNLGYTIKAFLETFKNKMNAPALIVKTQQAGTSIMDREAILDRIDSIRRSVKGTLPNVYLFHGEISDDEINALYNHSKVKVLVSLTKGEGFGRPLLEYSLTGKPMLVSGWSGQTDFLDPKETYLIGGTLTPVHKSSVLKDMILEEAHWFTPSDEEVGKAFKLSFEKYDELLELSKKQAKRSKENFSYIKMVELLDNTLDKYLPEFPEEISLDLPELKLPKLDKIDG